ncbi:UDP-N-acetylmuramoyl-tripeptide--D-alanyl-D-alanine ligase [candidate division WOR-3 bacterium]|nr:UDP-N-acetylmuramoyl-tripeptide--D-alanyl-D-alanine ligase [candidate division WOR-3 bacterium]
MKSVKLKNPIKVTEIIRATHGTHRGVLQYVPTDIKITGISIDSRTTEQGDIFIALKGERFDGHLFVKEALQKGAVGAIVNANCKLQNARLPKQSGPLRRSESEASGQANCKLIMVKDTLRALGDLASDYRKRFSPSIVSITGSNGKTTTKELAALCLSGSYRVLKNERSLNSLVGLPLTLFSLSKDIEICILELGTNQPGEIARLSEIACPTSRLYRDRDGRRAKPKVGVITNIALTHLEGFKTLRGVFQEKLKLINFVDFLILNADDDLLWQRLKPLATKRGINPCATGMDIFWFGIKRGDLRAQVIGSGNRIKFRVRDVDFELPLFGIWNIYNALAALSIGIYFDLSLKVMSQAIRNFKSLSHRGKIINCDSISVIDSTYNANPVSVKLSLQGLGTRIDTDRNTDRHRRRVAILGDMLELGEESQKLHSVIGKSLKEFGIDVLIGVGKFARYYVEASNVRDKFYFSSKTCSYKPVIDFLKDFIKPGDVILVKGSRAMQMEKIVNALRAQCKIKNENCKL